MIENICLNIKVNDGKSDNIKNQFVKRYELNNNIYQKVVGRRFQGVIEQSNKKMDMKEVQEQDVLTNLLIKSKSYIDGNVKYDYKLNYNKVYNNPKEYEVSYVDALANLEQINQNFRKRINQKNIHYNFFLDDSQNPSIETPIDQDLYNEYIKFLSNNEGELFTYTLKDTWTKGKDFFFIKKGTVMKLVLLHEDRIFADVEYQGQVGLMKLQQLKIIVSQFEN